MSVLVHKAVEPDKLTVKGRKRLDAMLEAGEFVLQPKLDGVYCQIVKQPLGWVAYSRTGEIMHSLRPEILAQFSGADPAIHWIGELWLPNTAHSDINGMSRKHSVQPLELHLFDATGGAFDGLPYAARHDLLGLSEWRSGVEVVKNLPAVEYRGSGAEFMGYLYELAAKIKAKASAYDGLVLKDSEGLFVPGNGRDGGALKIKPRASGDFLCVGATAGIGNREGGMGAAIVALGGGVTCEVGSGFSLVDVHDRGAAYFVGKILEVEYLAITKDGRLREPVFKAVRVDKHTPDVLACNVASSD